MAITTQQLSDLKADLGTYSSEFSDAQLGRNWDRCEKALNEVMQIDATLALCFQQVLAKKAAKIDVQMGQVSQKDRQEIQNIQMLIDMYMPALERIKEYREQVVRSRMRLTPNQRREEPFEGRRDFNPNYREYDYHYD